MEVIMRIELDFREVINESPVPMEWVIARLESGKTISAYQSYNGSWYDNEGQYVSGVTHWADLPLITI